METRLINEATSQMAIRRRHILLALAVTIDYVSGKEPTVCCLNQSPWETVHEMHTGRGPQWSIKYHDIFKTRVRESHFELLYLLCNLIVATR